MRDGDAAALLQPKVGARYASRAGAKLVALEAGHFSMLVRSEETNRAAREFVGEVLRGPPGS